VRKQHCIVVAGLTAALIATGGPAMAESKSKKDKTGDANAVVDITRVTVANTGKSVKVQVKLAKVKAGRIDVTGTITPNLAGAPTFQFATDSTRHGKATVTLTQAAAGSTETASVECHGLKATVSAGRRGQVLVRVPQVCLGEAADSVAVTVATVTAAGATADTLPGVLDVAQG
jgi:hypothetical protein